MTEHQTTETPPLAAPTGSALRDGEQMCDKQMLAVIHKITGIPFNWYHGNKRLLEIEGEWQLMPRRPSDEDAFWDWHLERNRQWYDSKHEAALALIYCWTLYDALNADLRHGENY